MTKTDIVNIVAVASLDQQVDFYDLLKFKEIQYDPEVYGGRVAYLKLPRMEGKVSIFPSGKMIGVGAKSEERAIEELILAKEFLVKKKLVKSVQLQPGIKNIVARIELEQNLNLEELARNCKMIYEPEQFPAGILRIDKPHKATFLLFASGKAIITGFTSSKQLASLVEELTKITEAFH
jgi:transcription initiation factor TFIID TATA-box-binding protein